MRLWSDNIKRRSGVLLSAVLIMICSIRICQAEEIDPTDISYVSVNPYTNEVTISWYKSESANIKFTRILDIYEKTTLVKGKGFVDLPGNEDRTFVFKTDTIDLYTFDANEKTLTLAVDAYSKNGTNSTSLREYHTTMIASAKITSCPSKIKISWTPYYGYGITIDKYEIIETSNNNETVVKELDADQTTCLLELNETQDRSFFVRASFTDCRGKKQTSTSCMCEVSQKAYIYPKFVDIKALDVINKDIKITCMCDLSSDFRTFYLYKTTADGQQNVLETFTLDSNSSELYVYVDTNAFETVPDSKYTLAVFDNCDSLLLYTSASADIIRVVDDFDENINRIIWNSHGDDVLHYRVWRSVNNGAEQLVGTTSDVTYDDDLSEIQGSCVSLCYRIETVYDNNVKSFSYSACINKEYKLLIPNAFNPYSNIRENKVFKPKYAFLAGNYLLKIYDRIGGCVFTSTDIDTGWDGTIKGKNAPEGTYQYKIQIELLSGETIQRYGVVNVIYSDTE